MALKSRPKPEDGPIVVTKQLSAVEIDPDREGYGRAIVGTIGAVDADMDVFLPGSINSEKERVPVFLMHNRYADTYGVAEVKEEGTNIVADFQLITNTDKGRHFYETLKLLGGEQEWSLGVRLTQWTYTERENREIVREISDTDVVEISAVTRGAQPGTETVELKSAKEADTKTEPEPMLLDEATEKRLQALFREEA